MSNLRHTSALILYRLQPQLELFLVRRSERLRAFPGQWTFPGGHVDTSDQISKSDRYADLELAMERKTALRELFEETGLVPFLGGQSTRKAELQGVRQNLLSTETNGFDWFQALNYQPPLEQLISIGLRVSPPITPKRFYTHYFVLNASGQGVFDPQQLDGEPELSGELIDFGWFRPDDLQSRWQQGEILIPAPVLGVLQALTEAQDIGPQEHARLCALANSETDLHDEILVHPGIEMIPLKTPTIPPASHTNTYLLGAQQFVIVDPATPFADQQAILKQRIQRRLETGARPQAILLTHHHPDHIGAVAFLRDWLHVSVCAHPATAERLEGKLAIDHTVREGFVWDLGHDPVDGKPWKLQAIYTPGHAPGHLCFLDLRHKVALVGDMLAGFGTILIKRPRGHMQDYLDSLQRLIDLDLLRALPAHGPLIAKPTEYCRYYIQHRLEREQTILTALASGPLSEDDLLAAVYADIDPRAITMARWTLAAHLHKLCSENRVLQTSERYQLH